MPTWGQLLQELNALGAEAQGRAQALGLPTGALPPGEPSAFDLLRRKYLKQLSGRTGRAVIVYATAWLENKPNLDAQVLSITLGDMAGLMEAVSNVEERGLDLFLHSPGGSAEAAESLIEYLRTRFDDIRVVVPIAAMSAATMVALAADEVVMGAHSQLGPIDPQFTLFTPEGPRSAPAQAILDQFELAKEQCKDPANIAAWLPILRAYLPGLLAQCDHQRQLAEEFVAKNLERHMLRGDPDRAKAAAHWFSEFAEFRSHGRRVSREKCRELGLKVTDMEADHDLQDAFLSVHHTYAITLANTATAKIIENHHGRAWVQSLQAVQILQAPGPGPAQTQPGGAPYPPAVAGQPRSNRQTRRGSRH